MIPNDPMIGGLKDFTPAALGELYNHIYARLPRPTGGVTVAAQGQVDTAGTGTGTGFAVSRSSAGTYAVTFDTTLSAVPTVLVTALPAVGSHFVAPEFSVAPSTSGFTVKFIISGGVATDVAWNFAVLT